MRAVILAVSLLLVACGDPAPEHPEWTTPADDPEHQIDARVCAQNYRDAPEPDTVWGETPADDEGTYSAPQEDARDE